MRNTGEILDDCLDHVVPFAPACASPSVRLHFVAGLGDSLPHRSRIQLPAADSWHEADVDLRSSRARGGNDRGLLPWRAPQPRVRREPPAAAQTFDLTPGHGVHVPVNAPHYVKNGPEPRVVQHHLPHARRRSPQLRVSRERTHAMVGITPRPVGKRRCRSCEAPGYALYKRAQRSRS